MSWGWLTAGVIVWLLSAGCIIGTIVEIAQGKKGKGPSRGEFWGATAFHGITAVVALWMILKAVGKG